ncbi:MAG: thioredoxin family protein [Phycisphaerales bacterium]|nr:thioredoxin family protein [Phycisphaerales bacterium]
MSEQSIAEQSIAAAFEVAHSYEDYLAASPDHAQAWHDMAERITLLPTHHTLLESFIRPMRMLVVSGAWCGDCVRQGPAIAAIAQACDVIDLRWIDRDHEASPIAHMKINLGTRVPVAAFMAEDSGLVSIFGDRTLACYRWMLAKKTGATCPVPGAPIPDDVLAGMVQDWVNECERVQCLLQLSPRLQAAAI